MVIVWRVTTGCNLGCGFCAFDRRLDRPPREADPKSVARFGEILGAWGRTLAQPPLVSWMGGEPLLWQPLKALTLHLHEAYGLRISATTNGTPLADAALRRHLLEHYAELTFSVDGKGPVHDRLRDWPGGYHWLSRQVTAFSDEKRRAGQGPRLRANVVMMRDNIDSLEQLCLDLAGWGVEEITFNQLGGRDRPEFFPAHCLLPTHAQRLAELVPLLREKLAPLGVTLRGSQAYLERIKRTAEGQEWPVDDCRPGRGFLFVHESGRAAPCSFTVDACGEEIGGIASVEDLMDLPRRFSRTLSAGRPPACANCLSTQVFGKYTKDMPCKNKGLPLNN